MNRIVGGARHPNYIITIDHPVLLSGLQAADRLAWACVAISGRCEPSFRQRLRGVELARLGLWGKSCMVIHLCLHGNIKLELHESCHAVLLKFRCKKTWCKIPCTQFDGSKSLRVSSNIKRMDRFRDPSQLDQLFFQLQCLECPKARLSKIPFLSRVLPICFDRMHIYIYNYIYVMYICIHMHIYIYAASWNKTAHLYIYNSFVCGCFHALSI